MRILSAWILTSAVLSAADVLVLDDGRTIRCRVLSISQEVVAFEVCDVQLSLPRSSIVRIERDVDAVVESPTVRRSATSTPSSRAGTWAFEAGLRVGYVRGDVDVAGTIVSKADGARIPESGTISLDGVALVPGFLLRAVWQPLAGDSTPILGLQAGHGFSSGTSATYRQTDVGAVAGWAWRRGPYTWSWQVAGGPSWVSVGRELTIRAPGVAAEKVEADAALRGWSFGSAAQVTYDVARGCAVGVSLGVQRVQADGSADWSSDGGSFSATEDLSSRAGILSSGVILGFVW